VIRVAQLLLVLAAIGLWVASRLTWVVLRTFDGLGPPRTVTLSGATWSNALIPFAVLLLAAAIAALAVRGWLLRLLSLLVALVGAGASYLGISLWSSRDVAARAAYLTDIQVQLLVGSSREHWGAALTLAAAAVTVLAAVLLMRVAVKGSSPAQKYESTTQRRAAAVQADPGAPMSERMMWDELDEGTDPTRDSGSEGR
jgi:uncharacterized membrane protein (TIGR02234 family)